MFFRNPITHRFLGSPFFHSLGFSGLLFLVCAPIVVAQTSSGTISGRTLDPSGFVVANAVVEVIEKDTRRLHVVFADMTGQYRFPLLPVGHYELRANAPGLHADPILLRLGVGQRWRIDIMFTLDTEKTEIDIVDTTPLLESENIALGSVVSRSKMENFPLNDRNFLQLSLLSTGVLPSAPGSELSRHNNSGLHANGAREASNNFLLDGVDNNDLYINRLTVSPPLDSVREFRLHSSSYRAEYGRSGGAQVNIVSQSGTNQLHGSLYNYLRNNAFDSRNFFDDVSQQMPIFQRNQFGASIGGAVFPKRTFFFGGYEGTRVLDGITKTARVPSLAIRTGDFSELPLSVIDPLTQRPFPDNRIPAERIDPIAQKLLSYWPVPNRPDAVQNLVSAPRGDLLVDQLYGRIDHYVSPQDMAYVRYNFSDDRGLEPFSDGNTNVPGFGSSVTNLGQNLVVSETHFFNPGTVAVIRFGFNRLRRRVLQENKGKDIAAKVGITGVTKDPLFSGFPAINVGGLDSLSDNTALPIVREGQTFHVLGNFTRVLSRHMIKWGGEYRRFSNDGIQAFFGRGQLNFLGAFTQNSISDFLIGLPTFTIQTNIDNPFRQRASSWNGFIQDDWRITNRLSLNFGLRYEWNHPTVDAYDRFTTFDFNLRRLVRAGTGEISRAGFRIDNNNFAPRIGVSWSPGVVDDLVLRAGWGLFYDITILEASSGLYFNPPFFDLRLFFPSQQNLLTLANPFPSGAGFAPPATVFAMQKNFRTPYVQHGNVTVEKALSENTFLRASYVMSKGTKLLRQRDLNQPAPGEGPIFLRQPISGFANVIVFESAASSIYHSGQFSVERRFAKNFSFTLGYTIGKSIDDASAFLSTNGDPNFPQNSQDLRSERGLSTFDQRNRLVVAASYAPFSGGHWVTKNWRFDLITVFQSGTPLTPQLSFDNSNTGNTGSIAGADRPNVIDDPNSGRSTPGQFFNTRAFVSPAPYTFGNAGRNIIAGPELANFDIAAVKSFRFGEATRLDFRIEAFNLFNRVNFGQPGRIYDQPGFGVIAVARSARQLQLSFRLSF